MPENPRESGRVGVGGTVSSACLSGEVATALAASDYSALHGIRCADREGAIVLSGIVPSYHLKQLAQVVAGRTKGVRRVENRLQVRSAR